MVPVHTGLTVECGNTDRSLTIETKLFGLASENSVQSGPSQHFQLPSTLLLKCLPPTKSPKSNLSNLCAFTLILYLKCFLYLM